MDTSDHTARDANGRFVPGCSGNPAGKRPGTRNRASVLAEALLAGEAEGIARVVIDRALAGDAVAARFCLDRLTPRPRGRAITLDVPAECGPGGVAVATFNAALRAMAAGEITPDEAVTVSRALEGRYRVLRAVQMERRLTGLGRAIPGDELAADGDDQSVAPASRRHDDCGDADVADDGDTVAAAAAGGTPALRKEGTDGADSVGARLVPARGPGHARPIQETLAPGQPRLGRNILSTTPALDLQTALRTTTSGIALMARRKAA